MDKTLAASIERAIASSKRYAQSTTSLSKTIVDLEVALNALPAKRQVAVRRNGSVADSEGLSFKRAKDGKWTIFYEPQGLAQLMSVVFTPGQPIATPLRDAPVEIKVQMAPLLIQLVDELANAMDQESKKAETASGTVHGLASLFKQGGV